jgi:muramidase (phage lysozyme)
VAIKSPLNPGIIAQERRVSPEAFQNFITGGSPLGESVLAGAANKIIGFQRGGVGVSGNTPDYNSIINTLSSNIITNVENRVQSINQNVSKIVNSKLSSIEDDYRQRIEKVDSSTPNGILSNFLKLYQQAIGYVQFLGNRKNIRTLGDNLQKLQEIFAETFNVAKVIRQTIVKIVKQLSNLPTSSATGGGGLDLNVGLPGGLLRRTAPRGIGKIAKYAAVGSAIAGAGALGTKVISGMMDLGGTDAQVDPNLMTDQYSGLTGPTLDRFNNILDRFSSAISNFRLPQKREVQPKVSSPPEPKPTPTPKDGGLTQDVTDAVSDPNVKSFLDVIAKPESGGAYNVSVGGRKFRDFSKHPEMYDPALGSDAAGRYQFISTTWAARAKELGLKDFSPRSQDLAAVQHLKNFNLLDDVMSGDPKRIEYAKNVLQKHQWTGLRKYAPGEASKYFLEQKAYYEKTGVKPATTQVAGRPQVTAAPGQATTQQQVAQQVSQPPATQQRPQLNIVPLTTGMPQTQNKLGAPVAAPPVMSHGGATVPFLSSTNHDNFLTLYSKMVYNIVDG